MTHLLTYFSSLHPLPSIFNKEREAPARNSHSPPPPPSPPLNPPIKTSMTTLLQKIVGVGDLVLLESIDEDAILQNLKKRLLAGDIYTYIGPVVISVNPYERHEELYADHTIDMYYGRNMYELPPHIYALTDAAYRDLVDNNRDQVRLKINKYCDCSSITPLPSSLFACGRRPDRLGACLHALAPFHVHPLKDSCHHLHRPRASSYQFAPPSHSCHFNCVKSKNTLFSNNYYSNAHLTLPLGVCSA